MLPQRKIIRLSHYDYQLNGAYYVTICTHQRRCAFGRIENGKVKLHPYGEIVDRCWLGIPDHFPGVILDEYVIMPNHIHGILVISGGLKQEPLHQEKRKFETPEPGSLSTVIGSFKSAVTREISRRRGMKTTVWQLKFYDHVVQDDRDIDRIRQYILGNPGAWEEDRHHPANQTIGPDDEGF